MSWDYAQPCRRSFFRYIIEVSANLIVNNLKEPVIVRDICCRGASIFCNYPLEISKEVEIEIIYFFDKPVCRRARVIWSKEISANLWQTGLDFGLDNLVDFNK